MARYQVQASQITWITWTGSTINGAAPQLGPAGALSAFKMDANGAADLAPGTYTITAMFDGATASATFTRVPNGENREGYSVTVSGPTAVIHGESATWTVSVGSNGVTVPLSSNSIDWFINGQAAGGRWGTGTLTLSAANVNALSVGARNNRRVPRDFANAERLLAF